MDGVAEHSEPFLRDQVAPSRYLFTFDQVLGMVEAGVLAEKAPVELIDGELITMSPENPPHSRYKRRLTDVLYRQLDIELYEIVVDAPLLLAQSSAPEPDLFVFRRGLDDRLLSGSQIELAIEVSHSSLRFDLTHKAALYARFSLPEYWVVDVDQRSVWVHRDPAPEGYRHRRCVEAGELLTALNLPLSFRLADLRVD